MTSKILFFFWLLAITVTSLVDYSSVSWLGLSKGFGTGFWLHLIGYFIAGLLFILAFGKKGQTYLLIARGYKREDIAGRFGVSVKTVYNILKADG